MRWFTPSVFPVLKFGFCPSEKEWEKQRAKALRQVHVEIREYPRQGMASSWKDKNGDTRVIVTLPESSDDNHARMISIIAHESWHVVTTILECMVEGDAGEETQAYLLGYVVRVIYDEYIRTRT